jgi:hypothetical protein
VYYRTVPGARAEIHMAFGEPVRTPNTSGSVSCAPDCSCW